MCMRDGRRAATEQRGGTHGDQGGGQGALRSGEEAASGLTHWGAWAGITPAQSPRLADTHTSSPARERRAYRGRHISYTIHHPHLSPQPA